GQLIGHFYRELLRLHLPLVQYRLIAHVVRETIKKIGYTDSENGFDYKSVGVHVSLVEQSSDIAQGVNEAEEVRDKNGQLVD
ncbi:hypothetical protein ACI3PF_21335, partial [Lactococcus lactis]